MATTSELLLDGFGRVLDSARAAVDGADERLLTARPTPDANTIAWLVWHLARVQDDHVSDAAGTQQAWTAGGWHERFGLPFAASATGYGFSPAEVGRVRGVAAEDLAGYLDAVTEATRSYVRGLGDGDLDRVVDESWDPPVTLAVRLVSVLADDLQHAGQAAYVRGCLS